MEIAPMLPEHGPDVLAIYQHGIDGGNATFEDAAPDWAEFSAGKLPDHRFVALDGAEVLGWVALAPTSGRPVYWGVVENSVYVHPKACGRGVGRALLEAVIDSSERAGIWSILAGIFPENVASLRLHEQLGFRHVGVRERMGRHDFGGRSVWRDVVYLERRSTIAGVG
ncbi:N-acetyltransferase family protein [Actinomadura rayongensis]